MTGGTKEESRRCNTNTRTDTIAHGTWVISSTKNTFIHHLWRWVRGGGREEINKKGQLSKLAIAREQYTSEDGQWRESSVVVLIYING